MFSRAGDGTPGGKRAKKKTCIWCSPTEELLAASRNKRQLCHILHAFRLFSPEVQEKAKSRAPWIEVSEGEGIEHTSAPNAAAPLVAPAQGDAPGQPMPQPPVAADPMGSPDVALLRGRRQKCRGTDEGAECRFSTTAPGDAVKNVPGGRCMWCSPNIAADLADKKKRARLLATFSKLKEEYKVILRARAPENLRWVERSKKAVPWVTTLAERGVVVAASMAAQERYRANVINEQWRARKTMGQPKKKSDQGRRSSQRYRAPACEKVEAVY